MNTRFRSRFIVLAAVAALLAGCTSTTSDGASSARKSLQLRVVTSWTEGTCTAPALTSGGPASACDSTGKTTYELSESLGTVTPTSVTLSKDQGQNHSVTLELSAADTSTFGAVSGKAINKKLAIVLDGRVLSAPMVVAAIATSPITLAFATASEARQAATELNAPATP